MKGCVKKKHYQDSVDDVVDIFILGCMVSLVEDVYMRQPPGFVIVPSMFYKLKNALYVLKHSPRIWFSNLSSTHFRWISSFCCLHFMFVQHTSQATLIVLVYVNSIFITGSDYLHQQFSLKNLGTFNYFLGIKVSQEGSIVHLPQHKFISDLLTEVGLLDSQGIDAPMSTSKVLSKFDDVVLFDPTKYRSYCRCSIILHFDEA